MGLPPPQGVRDRSAPSAAETRVSIGGHASRGRWSRQVLCRGDQVGRPCRVQAWAASVERVESVDEQVGPEIVTEVQRGIADELIEPSFR